METTAVKWQDSEAKKILDQHLLKEVPRSPQRMCASVVVLREFQSTAVLTTEGQILDVEMVRSGFEQEQLTSRVVLQKRKQIAPERRTGRAFYRSYTENESCDYMKEMCGKCPDCLIYGFAATKGEGAQRSRVLTDTGFAIRSYEGMQRSITLNAIQDTTAGGISGSAFAEREHIRPQVFFPTVETLVDVTPAEFVYVLRNILTTTRYGGESSRQGSVANHPVALFFGRGELMSNLALTQHVYDRLYEQVGESINESPLNRSDVEQAIRETIKEQSEQAYFPIQLYEGEELQSFLTSLRGLWRNEEECEAWQTELEKDHQTYLQNLK